MLDFLTSRSSFGERAGTLGLKTVATSAKFPIVPALKDGLGSVASLGREHEPGPELPDEDDGEPRYRTDAEGPRTIHLACMAELWLMDSPRDELRWGERRAREATLAFVDGWASTAIHRLAEGPIGLATLDRAIAPCLEAMDRHGIVEFQPGAAPDCEDRYALTEWGRAGVGPLIASARLERTIPDATRPIEEIDVQAAFGLALPLLRLPSGLSGSCALSVDPGGPEDPGPVAVAARFEHGRLAAWESGPDEGADARVWGGVDGWLRATIEGRLDGLAAEGDVRLATAILEALHERLFGLEE